MLVYIATIVDTRTKAYHDSSYVAGFKFADGQIQWFLHVRINALRYKFVQVDASSQ